jgi:hypothetical protein
MKYRRSITIPFLLINAFFVCCNTNSDLKHRDWNCKTIDEDKICIPSSWEFKHQSKALFFSYLNNKDDNSYFAVLKYNRTTSGLDAIKYLKQLYVVLQKKDTIETSQGYSLKKLISDNNITYYNEIYTKISNKPYLTYSTVFEKDDDLYEIVLKVEIANSVKYKVIYRDILFNFHHKDKPIFSPDDKINEIQVIDLSKL